MKITKTIEEILMINEAVVKLMKLPGIVYDKVYWFDKLRKNLYPVLKEWQEKSIEIYNRYAIPLPENEFILPIRYAEFKAEILKAKPEQILAILKKYETKTDHPGEAIPNEKVSQYKKEIDLEAGKFPAKEIEYTEVELDNNLIAVMRQLPGELQMALSFMFKEKSNIALFPRLQ